MTNRRERRAALGALGRVGRAELNELKGITETDPAKLELAGALRVTGKGRDVEILANGNSEQLLEQLKSYSPEELKVESLSLEEIFVASKTLKSNA